MPPLAASAALVDAASGDFFRGHLPGAGLLQTGHCIPSRAAAFAADRAAIKPT